MGPKAQSAGVCRCWLLLVWLFRGLSCVPDTQADLHGGWCVGWETADKAWFSTLAALL